MWQDYVQLHSMEQYMMGGLRVWRSGHRGLAALVVWSALLLFPGCSEQSSNGHGPQPITLYGNVDIREVQLAFQDTGRIVNLAVDEGAKVRKGQVLAELDPARYRMARDQLSGEVAAQANVVERMHAGSRPQEIERVRASLASAKANLHNAQLVFDRKLALQPINRISQQEVDSARAQVQTWQAAVKAAEEDLSLLLEGPRREDVAAAEASLAALRASLDLANQRLHDTRLLAPSDGFIRNRILEPGALAQAGASVLTLSLIDPLWVRAYVSEPDLGHIREGMPAEVRTDSMPGKAYNGWVGFVSSTAEFTPKTVETTELRTKLVYRARIFVCDPQQELRLGMPVTVTVLEGKSGASIGATGTCSEQPQPANQTAVRASAKD